MFKNQKIANKPVSDFVIGIYIFGFVSVRGASFDIRISDFVSVASCGSTSLTTLSLSKGRDKFS